MGGEPSTGDGREPASARPLLGHCLAFTLGIALGIPAPWLAGRWLAAALVVGAVVGAARGRGRVALAAGLVAALALGAWRAGVAVTRWEREPLHAWVEQTVVLDGVVCRAPERRERGVRLTLAVTGLTTDDGRAVTVGGRVSLTAETAAVTFGDRLRVRAHLTDGRTDTNPGAYSQRVYLRHEGLVASGWAIEPPLVLAHGQGPWLEALAEGLRDRLCGAVEATMPGPAPKYYADLLNAMVFGVTAAPVAPELAEMFREAGVTHVLVASGTQVSLLLGVLLFCGRVLPLPRGLVSGLGVVLVGLYCLVTGFPPSVVRASLTGLIVLLGLERGRDYDPLTALAFAAAAMLLGQPLQLQSISFQLGFAATAGILLVGLPLSERWAPRLGPWLAGVAAFTLAAQVFVAPLLVIHFRRLSLVGLVANLPVIPVSGLLVWVGVAGSLSAALGLTPLARLANGLAHLVLAAFVGLVRAFAALPGATIAPVPLTPTLLLGLAVALGGLWMSARPTEVDRPRANRWLWLPAGLAVWAGWLAWQAAREAVTVRVLDVGNGDSLLLEGPTGRRILVDGGPGPSGATGYDAGAERVVPALAQLGVGHLDAVVGTHPHADHIGGLAAVVEAFPTDHLLLGAAPRDVPAVDRLLAAAGKRGLSPELLRRGDVLDLGGGARIEVLWPPPTPVSTGGSAVNNHSVVLKLVYGRTSFLLGGDLESAGEDRLIRHAGDLTATVLKVPHQGSRTSCTDELLARVRPRFAVLGTGPNNYGQPAPETLARLDRAQVTVNRTDRDGMVTYRSDGHNVIVETYGRH